MTPWRTSLWPGSRKAKRSYRRRPSIAASASQEHGKTGMLDRRAALTVLGGVGMPEPRPRWSCSNRLFKWSRVRRRAVWLGGDFRATNPKVSKSGSFSSDLHSLSSRATPKLAGNRSATARTAKSPLGSQHGPLRYPPEDVIPTDHWNNVARRRRHEGACKPVGFVPARVGFGLTG
jgi:hypothetical protein